MPLRLLDLIAMPELRTRPLADRNLDRAVRWAHVCELSDPTEWLGEGDLLMTTGIGIPRTPADQAAYVTALSQAGLAGLMIGENMQAPADLSALYAAAERLGFPVLLTEYGVPFASVTRAIVDAGRQQEFERRNTIARLCASARVAMEGLALEPLLNRLEQDIGAGLLLLDPQEPLRAWLPRGAELLPSLREAVRRQPLEFSITQPLVRRYPLPEGEVLALSVPSRRGGVLLVRGMGDPLPDYSLLHHLVAVVGIAMERLQAEAERALRLGAQILDDLLAQRLSPHQAAEQLEPFHLRLETACLAVTRPPRHRLSDWSVRFQQLEVPVVLRAQGDEVLVLAQPADLPFVASVLGGGLGASLAVGRAGRMPDALREARLAEAHAGPGEVIGYSGHGARLPWLPGSLTEAADAFQAVLGPLRQPDQPQGGVLLLSLRVFLEENRSWQAAAARLNIHKTTLIYRIRKVESLTGRSLDRTEDVAVLWLALRAGDLAGGAGN